MENKNEILKSIMIQTGASEDECLKWYRLMNGDVFKTEKVLIERNRKRYEPQNDLNNGYKIDEEEDYFYSPKIEKIGLDKNSVNDLWMELHLLNIKAEEIIKLLKKR